MPQSVNSHSMFKLKISQFTFRCTLFPSLRYVSGLSAALFNKTDRYLYTKENNFFFLKTPEELDDSDFETEDFDVRSRTSVQTEDDQLIAGKSARVREMILVLLMQTAPDRDQPIHG